MFYLNLRSMIEKSKLFLLPKSIFFWIFLLTFISLVFGYYSILSLNENIVQLEQNKLVKLKNEGYVIKTSGCRIPEMFVTGPLVDRFLKTDDNIDVKCDFKSQELSGFQLITSNLTTISLNYTLLKTLNITKSDPTFNCYYSSISRFPLTNDDSDKNFDNKVKIGPKIKLVDSIIIQDEFVKTWCTRNSVTVYTDYHGFFTPKSSQNNYVITKTTKYKKSISVLILGLDAVSRLNFHRQMPKTATFLSELDTVEMLGYNKVEDNTFLNLVPVLSGFSVEELTKKCHLNQTDFFDKCNFIWNEFSRAGFETAFGEDSPFIGAFNYLKYGFRRQPTDRYIRPLMIASEKDIGHNFPLNTFLCTGSRLSIAFLLDYVRKYVQSTADKLSMGFFWSTSLTHDYLNLPKYGDQLLKNFFDSMNQSGYLNRMVVILMSDHGLRWGSFRETYQGYLEDRLPMLNFIIPKWFREEYPKAMENLQHNTIKLTTPYDLHKTLLEFINLDGLKDESVEERQNSDIMSSSLFLKVSDNRTCESSGIPKHYCACHNKVTSLRVKDSIVLKAVDTILSYINTKLSDYPLCAKLKVLEVLSASEESGNNDKLKDYVIQITTTPGKAIFEATIRHTENKFQMVGSISRLNLYGDQSTCVNDAALKLLCYCLR
ncbi:uncharacterized protein LOC126900001 isoform X2 [Daktulosphaira vitifoliae]|uniref:uncharacterized protein LOC126900001 isoform X2 n=1 Tax=Daktulosphaira vitifoliae TaxID=58002 RepID=UPI0021A99A77|nr:uncharacterized protein LOC126900001 isoform X2 [Daktulosphaira vitifoliae]